ncbi:MAG: sigma 54-interacting transcriptional regulator [Alphaproteobacteria bacterium]|nr:sigma 54-interacting transcriptional regulator [Alphaproteobacteria bacterium]
MVTKRPPHPVTTEASLRSQAARTLLKLFDSLYEGAVAIDREARIVWMNDKYRALLGWNGTEPIEGRPVEEVIPDSLMRRVVDTGRADLLDVFTVNKRQMVVSRIPLFDERGKVTGALGIILYDRLQALKPLVSKFQRMHEDLARARRELAAGRGAKYSISQFVGQSGRVRELKEQAMRAAERDSTVLLLGETGTGKELLAHAIHAASPRASRPLVGINTAAIPESLLEGELFGAAPGAYTGAGPKDRPGKFQLADGGTLFLDEVGDMPLTLQAKLLRVLQEREVEPLGSNRLIPVDVRVIAATSRDLRRMVEQGSFRADLYYRLNVLPLVIPPLRERLSDLPALCAAILEGMALSAGGRIREVSASAIARLARHDWPGNVRELKNILEQAVAATEAATLGSGHFDGLLPDGRAIQDLPSPEGVAAVRPLREVMAEAERAAILSALDAAGGVRAHAARALGISRAQFYEKLSAHGLLSENPVRQRAV